jgi:DNA-binding MarR family transcriptional regulator
MSAQQNVLQAVRLLEAGPLSISELAKAIGVSVSGASRIVDAIEKAGFPVVREFVPSTVKGGGSTVVRIAK